MNNDNLLQFLNISNIGKNSLFLVFLSKKKLCVQNGNFKNHKAKKKHIAN